MRRAIAILIILALGGNIASAGLDVVRSNGITLTGADGVRLVGLNGITLTGADGFMASVTNGITLTGADGVPIGLGGVRTSGASGITYAGPNSISVAGTDGITLTGADGISFTGPAGITLTGADGSQHTANSVIFQRPSGITLTGADGITLTGADGLSIVGATGVTRNPLDGITLTGADGITLTGADGITLTGADGITLTGADSVVGLGPNGILFSVAFPNGITLTGADTISTVRANGITFTGADGIRLIGHDGITFPGEVANVGLQGFDPELAAKLNAITDDSTVNAVIAYHSDVTSNDLLQLTSTGIIGGTRFRRLPMVVVTATKQQLITISRLARVRSIYGNRTLTFNSDPYFNITGIIRAAEDADLRAANSGLPYKGRNVNVAVLDTGINGVHADLSGRIAQNVRLLDLQSIPIGFQFPIPIENLPNSDPVAGHGTFVAGIIAANGNSSAGRFDGVASGANLLGLSAGDVSLTNVLSGFDYVLDKRSVYNTRVINCSFSANTAFDLEDPVNISTKLLTEQGVNVVFSAGNSGRGNGTLNPYARAPWVVSVGATDQNSVLASFSSRGDFGNATQRPTLVAPGVDIVSVRSPTGVTGINGVGAADLLRLTTQEILSYTTASGTSFSAPQVTAAIALMLEASPSLTPAAVKDILSRTATPMPKYFAHEVGAGMLNTHAAVLEAKFTARRMGQFRSTMSRNNVRFDNLVPTTFSGQPIPGSPFNSTVVVPENTLQTTVTVSWNSNLNDLGLRLYDASGNLVNESNRVNLLGLFGLREKVAVDFPTMQNYRANVYHTLGLGTLQNINGTVDRTVVNYPAIDDLGKMTLSDTARLRSALMRDLVTPENTRFRPYSSALRFELADGLMRTGHIAQFVRSTPMFSDVTSPWQRTSIESIQSSSSGAIFYDAAPGGAFRPYSEVTRLTLAIAAVRAAGLESLAPQAQLSRKISDFALIPHQYRGHVALALHRGFLRLDGNSFRSTRPLTRLEMAVALDVLASL
ncbi:MAG TPA: S8 family serine peptidase [Pyrinomonadaceae bacterium]|nr:S8 family serine peptidase [Pyrinomonadaceae bacterium]